MQAVNGNGANWVGPVIQEYFINLYTLYVINKLYFVNLYKIKTVEGNETHCFVVVSNIGFEMIKVSCKGSQEYSLVPCILILSTFKGEWTPDYETTAVLYLY